MKIPLSPIIDLTESDELLKWKRQWILLDDHDKHIVLVVLKQFYDDHKK